jgi:glycosyltransferase involved in cell wall biosynthesis
VVAYVGFIYPPKGIREFLLAAARVRAAGHDATFLVVGGAARGPAFSTSPAGRIAGLLGLAHDYEQDARDLVRRLRLDDHVVFIQFTDSIEAAYRAADILVAPSLGPEIARPVAEAAATGIPVVALGTRTGGGIILAGRTGMIAPEATAEALAGEISALLTDPAQRLELGRAARSYAEATFDPDTNTRLIEAVYDRALASALREPRQVAEPVS